MAGTSTKEQTQRLKVYRAHQIVHNRQVTRRVRDQWLAGAAMVAAVTIASLGYWAWAEVGPGAPTQEEIEAAVSDLVEDLEAQGGETEASTDEPGAPDPAVSEYRAWDASMTIDGVDLELSLNGFVAPQAVANFISLAQDGYYDQTGCHRLTTAGIFVLQCGDPEGTGQGGPGYTWGPIENAPEDDVYAAGVLAMARVGGDAESMGSQFFIVYEDSVIPSDSVGGYTVFGRVTSGLDEFTSAVIDQGTVDEVPDGQPLAPAEISSITIR